MISTRLPRLRPGITLSQALIRPLTPTPNGVGAPRLKEESNGFFEPHTAP